MRPPLPAARPVDSTTGVDGRAAVRSLAAPRDPEAAQAGPPGAGANGGPQGPPLVSTGISERSALAAAARGVRALRHQAKQEATQDAGAPWRPRYVRDCAAGPDVAAGRAAPMILRTWPRGGDPADGSRQAARCGSWRCPSCAWWRNAQDFARIVEAFAPHPVEECTFMVLTVERRWSDPWDAYRALSRQSRNFLARLRRAFAGEPGSRWVMAVEQHRDGYPHVNLLMHAPILTRLVRASVQLRRDRGLDQGGELVMKGDLLRCATETGWGWRSTAEPVRVQRRDAGDSPHGQAAGYLVKVAARETSKLAQLPTEAPKNFRRLRAGLRFLPPVRRDPSITGAMLRVLDGCIVAVGRTEDEQRRAELDRAVMVESFTHRRARLAPLGARPSAFLAIPSERSARARASSPG